MLTGGILQQGTQGGSGVLGSSPLERREADIESPRAGRARQSASLGNYKEARPLHSLKLVFHPPYIGILVSWREIGKGDLQDLRGIGRGICWLVGDVWLLRAGASELASWDLESEHWFKAWLLHSLALWSRAGFLTSPCLNHLISKMEITTCKTHLMMTT